MRSFFIEWQRSVAVAALVFLSAGSPLWADPTPAEPAPAPAAAAATGEQVLTPRAKALEVAGAFSNDGFKTRDSHWEGEVSPGKPVLIQVNLFSGNQYWFIVAGKDDEATLKISVFDEKGQPARYEEYLDGSRAAAGFSPSYSGPFYLKVEEGKGKPTSFCLLYSYK